MCLLSITIGWMTDPSDGLQALNCLINEIHYPDTQSDTLTATMLLSSYEVLQASDAAHRLHHLGALKLICARNVCLASTGLDRANFIVYVRHDLTIALANESPLQLDPALWCVNPPDVGALDDQWAIYLLWLAAIAVNLVHSSSAASAGDRDELIDKVERWYKGTNPAFRGVEYGQVNDEGLQKTFFPVPASGKPFLRAAHDSMTMYLLIQRVNPRSINTLLNVYSSGDVVVPSDLHHSLCRNRTA
jgi:hypothetical protein